jgi:uncharacterized membrane protein
MSVLTIGGIIAAAFRIGMANAGTIIGAGLLWILTIWIPYLNVGTTIAMLNMIVKLGRGESFTPMEIFNKEYRANMGEFFLLFGFVIMGIFGGLLFAIIPGIILYFAWSQAFLLMEAQGMSPLEAIRASNKMTYGDKWNMFLGVFLLQVIVGGAFGILGSIFGTEPPNAVTGIISFAGAICYFTLMIGAYAHIYGTLEARHFGAAAAAPDTPPHAAFAGT